MKTPKITLSVRVTEDIAKALYRKSQKLGISMNMLIYFLLRRETKNNKKDENDDYNEENLSIYEEL